MHIKNLRYNAANGVFQASVDIERFGRTFRYPCEIAGPQNMERAAVIDRLRHKALQMSDTPL
ncbi:MULTISPECIES: orotidine 5'-phosphate decarboxylase [unclassified Yoonia]|uniref:orotidine 5'-phosphate decarboxylase n=1 Tax=unclassified Yoonia TaxID=2629118 RepID=UPI0037299E6B